MAKKAELSSRQVTAVKLVFGDDLGADILDNARTAAGSVQFKDPRAEQARSAIRFWRSACLSSADRKAAARRQEVEARARIRAIARLFTGGARR